MGAAHQPIDHRAIVGRAAGLQYSQRFLAGISAAMAEAMCSRGGLSKTRLNAPIIAVLVIGRVRDPRPSSGLCGWRRYRRAQNPSNRCRSSGRLGALGKIHPPF